MLDFAIDLAHRAGAILRAGQERERSVAFKRRADLVTDIDKASEALIVAAIGERYPGHAILAEEGGAAAGAGEYQWVIDPLDGTLNYVHGMPIYCVSIGLLCRGELSLGVVYDPTRDELFAAEAGRGAFCNGRRLRVSSAAELGHSMLTTGFPYDRFSRADNNLAEFGRLLMKARDIRRPGAAALDLAYVAAGRSDAHWELGLAPWDTAAGALLVREAGGALSDWRGEPWRPGGDRLVASNGHIHAEILREL
ncbi:inositol monophosphatase [Oscillochloris sp. ZM17-4]|uniref:inositol monophosphatase family protein n=1 Tax=Oscillochloris sp. ZM17-4 TaxID=2866714 RepID=UPI001C734634|nr:inositol monophosphatase family protein [Oscillochloris sp. ZM17-4]MBX0327279.1 inositol monophosphatase [Oscillochloris sp. ZM17-4]